MLKLGLCITGSFCSMDDMLFVLKQLVNEYDIEVFLTPNVQSMDTRFYSSALLIDKIETITNKPINNVINFFPINLFSLLLFISYLELFLNTIFSKKILFSIDN